MGVEYPLIDADGHFYEPDHCFSRHVLFGSDHPHPEGLREPADLVDRLAGCDPVPRHKVLRGNTAGLLGLPDAHPVALPA